MDDLEEIELSSVPRDAQNSGAAAARVVPDDAGLITPGPNPPSGNETASNDA